MSDVLKFASEDGPERPRTSRPPWRVLIVDDEIAVHTVTELALRDFRLCGRGISFLHAYSGQEALALLSTDSDIALMLLDVVMESDDAGLEVVKHVRNVLANRFIRILLRTGQPGHAPELEVITNYDINGYMQKTELTSHKLYTAVYTGLSTYRDLTALEANRRGLEKIIDATARLLEIDSIGWFAQGVLEQLAALLFFGSDALIVRTAGVAAVAAHSSEDLQVIAGTGRFEGCIGRGASTALPLEVADRIRAARETNGLVFGEDHIVGCQVVNEQDLIFYVAADEPMSLPDRKLLELFYRNVGIAYGNLFRLTALARGGS